MGVINFVSFSFIMYFKKYRVSYFDHYFKVQIACMILLNLLFVLVAFINPGIVITQPVPATSEYCEVCKFYKGERQIHCDACQICMHGYQFHCPLLGICIAKHNSIAFYFFVFAFVHLADHAADQLQRGLYDLIWISLITNYSNPISNITNLWGTQRTLNTSARAPS